MITGIMAVAQVVWGPGARGWCQGPGIGEALNPGPPAYFDLEDTDCWDEDTDNPPPIPGEAGWPLRQMMRTGTSHPAAN